MNDPIDMVFAALANPTRRELLRLLRDEGQQPVHNWRTTSLCSDQASQSI